MALPNPGRSESLKEFTKRFMSDPVAVKEFPDVKQRYAVLKNKWAHRKSKASVIVASGDDETLYGLPEIDDAWLEEEAGIELDVIEASTDKPYGNVPYADPGYQPDGKKRYPVDTEEHIRSAWKYLHQKKNAAKYTADQLRKIKARIISAWKRKIDKAGPPSAKEE